jgi:uroporphyrinogen-III synthase
MMMMTMHAPDRTAPTRFAGATLVVTRPAASAASLKRRIVALGGVALSLPGAAIRAVENADAARAALAQAARADLVIFVSPNAVRHAFALSPGLRFAGATQVSAIGAASARALVRRGVDDVLFPPERQDSEGLLALPAFARLRGRHVALVGAPGGRDTLPDTLRARGAKVQHVDVYRRGAPRLTQRHFRALAQAAGPLLTLLSSAQALQHLQRLLPAPLFARLAAGEGIVSSLRLAEVARAAGFVRVHVAASAGSADMLATAAAALAQHRV